MELTVEQVMQSREVASDQISAAVDRADASFAAASVTAQAAVASALIYLGDVIRLGFQPPVSALDPRALEEHLEGLRSLAEELGEELKDGEASKQ